MAEQYSDMQLILQHPWPADPCVYRHSFCNCRLSIADLHLCLELGAVLCHGVSFLSWCICAQGKLDAVAAAMLLTAYFERPEGAIKVKSIMLR